MNTITIHPAWVRRWGSPTATILGAMLEHQSDEGWFTYTYRNLDRTLHTPATTFIAARRKLVKDGVLREDVVGGGREKRNRYLIDRERLAEIEREEA